MDIALQSRIDSSVGLYRTFTTTQAAGNGLPMRVMTDYIDYARSAFSFLEGASVPEEFAEVCVASMPAMALLDRDGVYGAPRFYFAAKSSTLGILGRDHFLFWWCSILSSCVGRQVAGLYYTFSAGAPSFPGGWEGWEQSILCCHVSLTLLFPRWVSNLCRLITRTKLLRAEKSGSLSKRSKLS